MDYARIRECLRRYKMAGVRLWLKVRFLEAEAIETLLCKCVTWSPNKLDYDRLRQVHHFMHLVYLG